MQQGRKAFVRQDVLRAPAGEEGAHHHLAFDADIPQAGAEGDDQADADQGERDPEIDDAAELAAVFEGAFPEGIDAFERVAPDGDDEDAAPMASEMAMGRSRKVRRMAMARGEFMFTEVARILSIAFHAGHFNVILTRCQALLT